MRQPTGFMNVDAAAEVNPVSFRSMRSIGIDEIVPSRYRVHQRAAFA